VSAENYDCPLIPTLRARVAAGTAPALVRNAILLDVGSTLGAEHYYALDDHPNANGHRAIAEALLTAMGSSP
jgi:hypothetical protein